MGREKLNADFNYDQPNKIKAWIFIGGWVWFSLIIGWAIFVLSLINNFEVPASGAVLVCSALISEIILQHNYWSTLKSYNPNTQFSLENTVHDVLFFKTNGYKIKATKQVISLFSIADEIEELWRGKESCWRAYKTATRASKIISIPIILTAIAGTLVWGYAHRYI